MFPVPYIIENLGTAISTFTRNALGIEFLDEKHDALPANALDKDQITLISISRKIIFQAVLWHIQLTCL